ncbi:AAA family ATPase [Hephaestia sp. GCM10023244]|uniref:AAA family ATPase n=1 Tax=unclassified Hephaestia TaxID=2631281 RepID=UPI0020775D0F|nr:AAA family ATPase [Hephaestia sp. MAHUQ-44]MCM8731204.1 AAA family ATPase [Hephaestia sp. MAHUQ-44]
MTPSDSLHVVTGGPGSGKTTLIDALAASGVATSPEVGRAIIREEMASGGTALPWRDHRAFAEKMLVREVAAHRAALAMATTVVLDRGVPDVIAFLRISGLAVPSPIDRAARTCRYNPRVFIAPWWDAIFTTDAERKQTADEARAAFAVMAETYRDYGYHLVELPRASVAARVAFVRDRLSDLR